MCYLFVLSKERCQVGIKLLEITFSALILKPMKQMTLKSVKSSGSPSPDNPSSFKKIIKGREKKTIINKKTLEKSYCLLDCGCHLP